MNYIKIKFINQLGKGPKTENVKIMINFVVWLIQLPAPLTIINFQLQRVEMEAKLLKLINEILTGT